jgi:hypothetical protein
MKKIKMITMMMSAALFLGGCGASFDMNVVKPVSGNSGSDENSLSAKDSAESDTGKNENTQQSNQNGRESSATGVLPMFTNAIGEFVNWAKDTPVYAEPSKEAEQVRTIDAQKSFPIYSIRCIDNALWLQIGDEQWVTSIFFNAEQLQLYVCDEIIQAAKREEWTGIKIDPERYSVSVDFVDIIPIFIRGMEIGEQKFTYNHEPGYEYLPYSIVFPPREYDDMSVGYLFVHNQKTGGEGFKLTVNESEIATFSVHVE